MSSNLPQKDQIEKARSVIVNLLDEEKEYKLREVETINQRIQQTEEQLDKLR